LLTKLLLLFLLTCNVAIASKNSELLQRAEKNYKNGSETSLFKCYNDYKNLYLRSILENDNILKRKALDGIIKSGKKLTIDTTSYKKELAKLKKTPAKKVKKQNKKPKKKVSKPSLKKASILKNVAWSDAKLVLDFNSNILAKQINYFKILEKSKKRYRYIFDIKASLKSKKYNLRHKELKRVRISQYKNDTLRIVFESKKALKLTYKREGKRLIINTRLTSVKAPHTIAPISFKSKTIVLDPGHGGKDSGAVGHKKYREKMVTMQISNKLAKILRKIGYTVYATRSTDKFIKLRKRTAYANKKKADIFISIHANSVPKKNRYKASGLETFFLSPARSKRAKNVAASENSQDLESMNFYGKQSYLNSLNHEKIIASHKLAIDLQQGMLSELRTSYSKVKDNGVKEGPFWVLVGAQMPAVLIEVGFISNPNEAERIASSRYQQQLAQGMADGIVRYFSKNR